MSASSPPIHRGDIDGVGGAGGRGFYPPLDPPQSLSPTGGVSASGGGGLFHSPSPSLELMR